jgi:hypothetical protein
MFKPDLYRLLQNSNQIARGKFAKSTIMNVVNVITDVLAY